MGCLCWSDRRHDIMAEARESTPLILLAETLRNPMQQLFWASAGKEFFVSEASSWDYAPNILCPRELPHRTLRFSRISETATFVAFRVEKLFGK
eukprot:1228764-Amphidinium_carterae.1